MENMNIKQKLRLFPTIATIITVVAGIIFYYFSHLANEKAQISSDSKIVVENLLKARISVYQFLRDPKEEKAVKAQDSFKLVNKNIDELGQKLVVKENQERVSTAKKLLNEYVAGLNQVSKMRMDEVNNGISDESSDVKNKIKEIAAIGGQVETKIVEIDKVSSELEVDAKTELNIALLLVFIALIGIPIILATKISNSILNAIEALKKGFQVVLDSHDTNHRLELTSQDEMQDVAKLFNEYMDKLNFFAQKDQEVINDIGRVTKMMECGFVSVRVKPQAGSPALQAVRNEFNHALEEMEKGLLAVLEVLGKFGTSDYTAKVETGRYSGELGGVLTGLQSLIENSGDLMALIGKNGQALNEGATILTTSSGGLAESANTQASSLEETAAAIEELTSNISANSQKASQMAEIAHDTQTAANDGRALADSTVVAMNEIQAATQAINNAVDIIDNIAFQTNILSLNAAVEAATAGDAGKGFAVVAQEVRNLAGRSAEAAKQIKELAELANSKSNGGIQVSHNMMKGFDVINEKISQTTQLVQDVANGSREQMAGINQINTAVAQLDQMTQQNASAANEVNKLAEDILGMSQMLTDTAARTKYNQESEHRVCRIDMMFETNKLKFDHVLFKNSNFGKIKDSVNTWTVTNETQCDLGKWIAAHSNESYANSPEWNNLLKDHAHVHQKVQEYINRERGGATPEELCRIAKDIEADTTQVFNGLNRLRTTACAQDTRE